MAKVFAEHDQKVATIARTVRDLVGRNEPVHIHKGGVHHVVPLPGDARFKSRPVDISALDQVLEIDATARTCTAEPGVTFAKVLQATLAHGLIPTVVPELEGITVGGAVAGCSVESMSYRYGGFHDSCLEYELVSGSGEVLTCSLTQEPHLFHMVHGSYGTLAILTKLTFRLVPAKPFVKMEYHAFPTVQSFHAEMLRHVQEGSYDFIDGILHSPRKLVLCLGRFVDSAPYTHGYRWLDIFYKSTATRAEDYLATADYCFRYDAECHWLTRTVPPLEWKPVRFLVGKWLLGSTNLITWSKRLDPVLRLKKRPEVVCDVFIPSRNFPEFFRWYEKEFDFFPLWVVPYRMPAPYPWLSDAHAKRVGTDLVIDCAVYGKPNNGPVDLSRLLEEETHTLDGIKTLISRNHYTPERFWEIYHQPNYQAAKQRLDPKGVFPGLFEKFHRVG